MGRHIRFNIIIYEKTNHDYQNAYETLGNLERRGRWTCMEEGTKLAKAAVGSIKRLRDECDSIA